MSRKSMIFKIPFGSIFFTRFTLHYKVYNEYQEQYFLQDSIKLFPYSLPAVKIAMRSVRSVPKPSNRVTPPLFSLTTPLGTSGSSYLTPP